MIRRNLMSCALALAGLTVAGAASAANIKVVNQDAGTGQGLDDSTPATPVGGNPGTTRGEQARIVFQFVADLWGSVLQSDVDIYNPVSFQALTCTATSGVLGSSGTNYVFYFNPGDTLPEGAVADTWYHSALADALAGTDLVVDEGGDPETADIVSRFNGNLGNTGCLEGSSWYFGLDGKASSDQIDLLNVVIHEMAHGLGFSGFNTLSTGAQFQGMPDIYSTFVKDNATSKAWTEMTDAERKTAALNDGHLVFTGSTVKEEAPLALSGTLLLKDSGGASYEFWQAQFGPAATASNFSGELAVPTSDALGCGTSTPVEGVSGKIAVISRGTCAFVEKAVNAEAGGATGLILVNTSDDAITPVGDGTEPGIPTIAVSLSNGTTLTAGIPGTSVSLEQGDTLAGSDADGNVQLYAPTTLAQGSSFSHYDTRLSPNAIMEYAINDDLQGTLTLDLTPALMKDVGWQLNRGNQFLLDCDTGVPTNIAGGPVLGGNIYSYAQVAASTSADVDAYRAALRDHVAGLEADGLLTEEQLTALEVCLNDEQTEAQFGEWGDGGGSGSDAIPLVNKTPVTGLTGGELLYSFEASAGSVLSILTAGGTGNVSVYVAFGEEPSAESYDFASTRTGNSETVRVTAPQAGTYYIKLTGTFSGVTLQARQ